jgi:phycoerythrin-associated linker protein
MRVHSTILDTQGYDAEIDYYIDSDEYNNTFGENFVPYIRGYKTEACETMVQFTHNFQMVRGASSSSLKGDLAGNSPKLNALVINQTATAVISPASSGASFRDTSVTARSRQGVDASSGGKVYRIEVTSIRANAVNRVSKFRRSNQVFLVPYDKLSEQYQRIHQQGGVIASVTAL